MSEPVETSDQLSPLKRAIVEIRELRTRLQANEAREHAPVAVIGAGLRFPGGATDLESFWRLLLAGTDAIGELPPRNWNMDDYYDPDPDAQGRIYSGRGGFLEEIDRFDPQFFGITPREAASMDPQQRLLLEVGWEALEHAGLSPERLAGSRTGLFIGISNSDYMRLLFEAGGACDPYAITGNALSVTASRLAYHLDLHGPCLALDTACSSSLVAIHLAVRSLRAGECDAALAGGVSLILGPEFTINFCQGRFLAPDGRCKTFSADADGYGRGEGCGVVVLKRLADALRGGDTILGVIRGSAVNHDGRSAGLTAPTGPAQEAVIRAALADAGAQPEEIGYVELHGTGTPLGDPIEARALGAVLGPARPAERPLAVGAVKTNLGHLEAAAGVAGFIKTLLTLKYGVIPPHLNLGRVNPHIPLDELKLRVPQAPEPWPRGEGRRLAGVSAFGLSGTNAHVILEEPPAATPAPGEWERPLHLLTLSAGSAPALRALAGRYAEFFESHPDLSLADAAHSAGIGRAHRAHRLAVVAADAQQAREKLAAFQELAQPEGGPVELPEGVRRGTCAQLDRTPQIVFLFTGQGGQYAGMGHGLYQTQPVFRQALERCDVLLRGRLPRPLLEVMFPESITSTITSNDYEHEGQTREATGLINETLYAQPATFAVEYALAELWRSWGIRPAVVLGHSLGEYAAACVAGVLTLEDAVTLLYERSRLTHSLPPNGRMAVVFADEATVAEALRPDAGLVSIAAINGPENTVISGTGEAVEAALARLAQAGRTSKPLVISRSFHSPQTEPILDEFERAAAGLRYAAPRIPLVSNLTGRFVSGEEIGRALYWRRHLREPVRFADSVAMLLGQGCRLFLELGPRPVLTTMGRQCAGEESDTVWLHSLRPGQEDWTPLLESLAELYTHGAAIDWEGFDRGCARRRVALPTTPFENKSYWIEQSDKAAVSMPALPERPAWETALGAAQRQAGYVPLDLALATYPARWELLERLTTAFIVQALNQLGAFAQPAERWSVESLAARVAIQPTYHHLLARWLDRLAACGRLEREGEAFSLPHSTGTLAGEPLERLIEEAWAAFADTPEFIKYVCRCGAALAPVVTGAQSALETLFPEGNPEVAEYLYGRWPVSSYFSAIAAAVASALAEMRAARPLRILEIGAGTGGTASAILPLLPAGRFRYHFTDVSEFFFARARERFGNLAGLDYGLLDIEKEPAAQGWPAHGFDLVVATNVLHATRDLEQTAGHVLKLLAPGGVLVLCEATRHLAWFDVTTGLIEGWQSFADRWRQDSPLLPEEAWSELLAGGGFIKLAAFPEAASPAAVLGQSVILAQAPLEAAPEAGIESLGAAGLEAPSATAALAQTAAPAAAAAPGFACMLREALPAERHELLVGRVCHQVGRLLRLEDGRRPDPHGRLMELGLDSLMAVELRNVLRRDLELERPLPATLIFEHPTAEAVATFLEREWCKANGEEGSPREALHPSPAAEQPAAGEIAGMSEAEVEALLLERLQTLKPG